MAANRVNNLIIPPLDKVLSKIPPHPSIKSDIIVGDDDGASSPPPPTVKQGVLTKIWSGDPPYYTHRYFIQNMQALPDFYQSRVDRNFDIFYWTPWKGSPDEWERLRPQAPLLRIINIDSSPKQLYDTVMEHLYNR